MLSVYLGSDVLAGLDPISTFFVCAQKTLGAFDDKNIFGDSGTGGAPFQSAGMSTPRTAIRWTA
jgi:hypothetical protein